MKMTSKQLINRHNDALDATLSFVGVCVGRLFVLIMKFIFCHEIRHN